MILRIINTMISTSVHYDYKIDRVSNNSTTNTEVMNIWLTIYTNYIVLSNIIMIFIVLMIRGVPIWLFC